MRYANERGCSSLQDGLDRNQAEACSQEFCCQAEQEQMTEMLREQGEEILFADRPRSNRFAVDLQDAFKS